MLLLLLLEAEEAILKKDGAALFCGIYIYALIMGIIGVVVVVGWWARQWCSNLVAYDHLEFGLAWLVEPATSACFRVVLIL